MLEIKFVDFLICYGYVYSLSKSHVTEMLLIFPLLIDYYIRRNKIHIKIH